MTSDLLPLLSAPVVFVAGKGGVGKSTAASALALTLADSGRRTHLISIDPAHSLADLFEQTLPRGEEVRSVCAPGLTLEEFDARLYSDRWYARVGPAIAEIMERGTYLDDEDVGRFLELSIPGTDEAMAALRLTELVGTVDEVVVDTPPAGHALRLVESGDTLSSWAEALDAMTSKAAAVVETLARRRVHFEADAVRAELRERVERFERDVLMPATWVVIRRQEPGIVAESERLRARLADRGLRVMAELQPGAPDSALAWRPDARGCDELRLVLRRSETGVDPGGSAGREAGVERVRVEPAAGAETAHVEPAAGAEPARRRAAGARAAEGRASHDALPLLRRDLLLFAGKGGVGKSTCAAAVALALAAEGPVALLGADPAGSLDDLLGSPPSGVPSLEVVQRDAESAYRELLEQSRAGAEELLDHLGIGGALELDRRVVESLLALAPPGIDEVMAMVELLDRVPAGGGRTVVDSSPTGHFLRLVQLPDVALRWTHALLRILQKYRQAFDLDRVTERTLRFAKNLRELSLRLRDADRSGVVVVGLDEPIVRAETARLLDTLSEAEWPVAALVWNRSRGREPSRDALPPGYSGPVILAPECPHPPFGEGVLLDFVASWERIA